MSVAIALKSKTKTYDALIVTAEVTFDDSYPTGGESISAASLGLKSIDFLSANPNGGYVFEFDHANSKLKAYWPGVYTQSGGYMIEASDKTNLSDVVCRIEAIGRPL